MPKIPAQATLKIENGVVKYFEFASEYVSQKENELYTDAEYLEYAYDDLKQNYTFSTGKSGIDPVFSMRFKEVDEKYYDVSRDFQEILLNKIRQNHDYDIRISVAGTDVSGKACNKHITTAELSKLVKISNELLMARQLIKIEEIDNLQAAADATSVRLPPKPTILSKY